MKLRTKLLIVLVAALVSVGTFNFMVTASSVDELVMASHQASHPVIAHVGARAIPSHRPSPES